MLSLFESYGISTIGIPCASADIGKASIETVVNSDGSLELNYTGEDPMLIDHNRYTLHFFHELFLGKLTGELER